MSYEKKIKTALVSVYHKDGLDEILTELNKLGVRFISTGGTRTFIESLGFPCDAVEDTTGYPSILGGRVKTLHPKIFGGILCRRDFPEDLKQIKAYDIHEIDLVIVDLYPFEETVASGADEADIIEKIDIGGISLIRAAAKNFKDVVIVASKQQYQPLKKLLEEKEGISDIEDRKFFAKELLPYLLHTTHLYLTIWIIMKVLLSVMRKTMLCIFAMGKILIKKAHFMETSTRYSTSCTAVRSHTIICWI